jgi:hypothetical protein
MEGLQTIGGVSNENISIAFMLIYMLCNVL